MCATQLTFGEHINPTGCWAEHAEMVPACWIPVTIIRLLNPLLMYTVSLYPLTAL